VDTKLSNPYKEYENPPCWSIRLREQSSWAKIGRSNNNVIYHLLALWASDLLEAIFFKKIHLSSADQKGYYYIEYVNDSFRSPFANFRIFFKA
jgi:hypothetical protein